VSGAANESRERWTFGVRYIPQEVPRASVRTTLTYRLHPRLTAGVEYNPRGASAGGRVSPLANLLVLTETQRRPAVIVGTSSDRIGTPSGQSFYATASKNLKRETRLSVAPYVGLAYSTYEDRFLPLAGLNVNFSRRSSALVVFDGVHVHPLVNFNYRRHAFSFLLARGRRPGLSYSVTF
jgi:hypothetical protein